MIFAIPTWLIINRADSATEAWSIPTIPETISFLFLCFFLQYFFSYFIIQYLLKLGNGSTKKKRVHPFFFARIFFVRTGNVVASATRGRIRKK